VCLTTGHLLKDPDAAAEAGAEPEPVPNDTDAILDHIGAGSSVAGTVRRGASKAARLGAVLAAGGVGLAYLYRKLRADE